MCSRERAALTLGIRPRIIFEAIAGCLEDYDCDSQRLDILLLHHRTIHSDECIGLLLSPLKKKAILKSGPANPCHRRNLVFPKVSAEPPIQVFVEQNLQLTLAGEPSPRIPEEDR